MLCRVYSGFIMKSWKKKKFCFSVSWVKNIASFFCLCQGTFECLKGKSKGSPYHAGGDLLGQEPPPSPGWQVPCSWSPHSPFCCNCIFQLLSGKKHSRTMISWKWKKWSRAFPGLPDDFNTNIRHVGAKINKTATKIIQYEKISGNNLQHLILCIKESIIPFFIFQELLFYTLNCKSIT